MYAIRNRATREWVKRTPSRKKGRHSRLPRLYGSRVQAIIARNSFEPRENFEVTKVELKEILDAPHQS